MTGAIRRILFLSHSHPFGPFRVGSHHYARVLAQRGVEVVHVSTPLSLSHRVTGRVDRAKVDVLPRGPHRDADGITHLVPRTLLPAPLGQFRVARELGRHGISPRFDAAMIDQPLLWDSSVRALAPRLVYRPTDAYPGGVKAALQRRIIAAADGVVATSSEVLRELGAVRVPTLVLENGVDAARFTTSADTPRGAVCVYVGALDDRFDWQRVDAWARANPEVTFTIAGPDARPPAELPRNVDLRGPVAYDALPALLQGARVGLLPLSDDPLNAGRSPMKLYEYLAAGLAVVSRATPVLRADEGAGVFTYSSSDDANAALARALANVSPNVAGVARAAGAGWEAKAAALAEFVGGLPVRGGVG